MGITPTNPASFTGSSSFSAQLQQVITNAVAAATAPITQLQNQQTTLTNQQSELQTLTSKFQSLQSAIDALNAATGTGAYSATSSDSSIATASVGCGDRAVARCGAVGAGSGGGIESVDGALQRLELAGQGLKLALLIRQRGLLVLQLGDGRGGGGDGVRDDLLQLR